MRPSSQSIATRIRASLESETEVHAPRTRSMRPSSQSIATRIRASLESETEVHASFSDQHQQDEVHEFRGKERS